MDMSRLKKIDDQEVKIFNPTKCARSEEYFFDKNGKSCKREDAVRFILRFFDESGKLINETWGECTPQKENKGRVK